MIDRLGVLWCLWRHRSVMYHGGAFYRCRKCWRRYAVSWAKPEHVEAGVYFQS